MPKRFYEHDPAVKQAVESIFLFPDEIQSIIAGGIATLAEKECQVKAYLDNLKTLGGDTVLSLYKSKRKMRKYDRNPHLHQAINYLLVLPDDKRRLLASKISELIELMMDYLKVCQAHQANSQLEVVQAISDTYVRAGKKQCLKLLAEIEKEFKKKIEQASTEIAEGHVTQEMKIRGF